MNKDKISLEFKNILSELDHLREDLESLGKSFGMSKKGVFQINLALEEVFTNIVSYGYIDKAAHWIKITIWRQNGILNVCVEDDGIPFNPLEEEVPDLECPIEDRRIGGLGCHFMRCFMDDVHYERAGNKNVLTMKKSIEGEKTS
jgi:serine/threonine-protein kinase RsbW